MIQLDFIEARTATILTAVTFHYSSERLIFLAEVMKTLAEFPVTHLHVIVLTNTTDDMNIEQIRGLFGQVFSEDKTFEIRSFPNLQHPYLLTWSHKEIIAKEFLSDRRNYTHFVYLEDDIRFSFLNFCYFISFRHRFGVYGLIPAFVRVEFSNNLSKYVNTDNGAAVDLFQRPAVICDEYLLVNLQNPYNAMFVLDVALAEEYTKSQSFSVDASSTISEWEIRERAAMGLTFEAIPAGFSARFAVPVLAKCKTLPLFCWVYHLPNNYAQDAETHFGKLAIDSMFDPHWGDTIKHAPPSQKHTPPSQSIPARQWRWYKRRTKQKINALLDRILGS